MTDTSSNCGPYRKARALIESIGGTMRWRSGGGPGGVWEITLHGRSHEVPVRDEKANDLDRLYVPEVDNPTTSRDYGSPGTLTNDAFWRLISLFPR